jgi:hypothetical protein
MVKQRPLHSVENSADPLCLRGSSLDDAFAEFVASSDVTVRDRYAVRTISGEANA